MMSIAEYVGNIEQKNHPDFVVLPGNFLKQLGEKVGFIGIPEHQPLLDALRLLWHQSEKINGCGYTFKALPSKEYAGIAERFSAVIGKDILSEVKLSATSALDCKIDDQGAAHPDGPDELFSSYSTLKTP